MSTTNNHTIIALSDVSYSYQRTDPNSSLFAEKDATTQTPPELICQLEEISLRIPAGSLVLLVGASGSGKTTLLRVMNALVPKFYEGKFTGTVQVAGHDLCPVELHDVGRWSATIFQNPRTQFFTSTVRTELAFALENYGVDPHIIKNRIQQAANQAGISHLLERSLNTLSGGQLQKVACACALVMDVEVLFFDEPTSNLGTEAIQEFQELIGRLKAAGKTIIVAEHRLYLFAELSDVVYRIADKKIIEKLSGKEFFALTADERIQRGLRSLSPPKPPDLPSPPAAKEESGVKPGLEIANLHFGYEPGKPVLDCGYLHLPTGAVTIISGDNGAGKTTLARLICGLATPNKPAQRRWLRRNTTHTQGKKAQFILDEKVLSQRARLQECAIVMQDVQRQLFSESVYREVTLGLSASDEATGLVDELLTQLELSEYQDRHPLSLSGGQAQRLVIAAAVAAHRRIVIFDEPTSGVDYTHLRGISELIRSLADSGCIVAVITHDPELVQMCGDYLIRIPKLSPTC
ncbi:ABC transporter ATP-binding protein [Corynebacterium kutscheri]|uniref:ABC transporter ATP-binding protein n=1 Tax=Corynebacterium kutscheri TaxID=35755 RepID=UPI0037C14F5E